LTIQILYYMALPYPTFINFKWYKTLWPELSLALLVQSPHLNSFPISTGSLSVSEQISRSPS